MAKAQIPPQLMSDLEKKLDVSTSRLYQLFEKKRKMYSNLIDLTQAAALVASENGLRIEKYFQRDFRDSLLKLTPLSTPASMPRKSNANPDRTKNARKEITFKFAGCSPESVPYVSGDIARDAQEMAKLYPKLYLFENSARMLITSRMLRTYGQDWWKEISRGIRDDVAKRKLKEGGARWHVKRGVHEVFYTDMDDLRRIIETQWSEVFEEVLANKAQVLALFHEIELSRNVIAHNNPLDRDTIERLESNFKVWKKQIADEAATP